MLNSPVRRIVSGTAGLLLAFVGFTLLLWPGIELARALLDESLSGSRPARQTWAWHRALTPVYAEWAVSRRYSGAAGRLPLDDIAGTEWPLFGSVFYLRATENLDRAWLVNPVGERPAGYAVHAIDAAAELLADPEQAAWVMRHWGETGYLHRENVFYRMLLIDGLASQARMTGSARHLPLLRAQVVGLADELSKSPTGLLADYPGQTFPADVAAAWHAIRRADEVLGTDHGNALGTALRGFVGTMAPAGTMPPYAWFGIDTPTATSVRGCANAWLLHHAPFLWPEQAREWFVLHMRDYWQQRTMLAGYREFARGTPDAFYRDVDSGPVIAGLGTAATAFGLGAARSMGAGHEARILGLQAIALSWPLPNGRLLAPRLMSDLSDAPLLGEAAMLYNLSQPAAAGIEPFPTHTRWGDVPGIVWLILALQWILGALVAWRSFRCLRGALRRPLSA